MKTFFYITAFLAMVILSLIGCSDKQNSPVGPIDQSLDQPFSLEKKVVREFSGSMDPTEVIDPGTIKEVHGKTIIRGVYNKIVVNAAFTNGGTDLFSGEGDLEMNGIVDYAKGTGYYWGKLKLTPSSPEARGGHWDLVWFGRGKLGPTGWTLPLNEIGTGKDGALTGLHLTMDNMITGPADWSLWHGEFHGFIKSHHH